MPFSGLLGYLFIFCARVIDMSCATVRTLKMCIRDRRMVFQGDVFVDLHLCTPPPEDVLLFRSRLRSPHTSLKPVGFLLKKDF